MRSPKLGMAPEYAWEHDLSKSSIAEPVWTTSLAARVDDGPRTYFSPRRSDCSGLGGLRKGGEPPVVPAHDTRTVVDVQDATLANFRGSFSNHNRRVGVTVGRSIGDRDLANIFGICGVRTLYDLRKSFAVGVVEARANRLPLFWPLRVNARDGHPGPQLRAYGASGLVLLRRSRETRGEVASRSGRVDLGALISAWSSVSQPLVRELETRSRTRDRATSFDWRVTASSR